MKCLKMTLTKVIVPETGFEIEWLLYSLRFDKEISKNINFSFNFFGLEAKRNSLGFRTNRVSQIDSGEERDLIKG